MRKKYKSIIKEHANSNTTKDRIFSHYLDSEKVILTEKEEEIRQRWSSCFSLLCQYHSVQQTVKVLVKEYGISESQAYRDVRDATELFGNVTESNKEAFRHILFEFAMKVFQLAASKNDLPEMNKSLQTMVKIKGLDKIDPDMPDFSLLQNNIYNINIEEQQLAQIKNMLGSGVINVDDLTQKNDQ